MKGTRTVLAWAVAAITLTASVTGLWHVAFDKAQMGYLGAGAIVAGFDITALLAGMKVVEQPKRASAWALLIAMAAVSAVCQILAAPEALGSWRLLHGAPPVIAIWTLHGAVAEVKGEDTKGKRKTNNKTRAPRNDAGGATPRPAAPPLPSAEGVQGHEISMAPVADLGARRKGRRRTTETGAAPLSPEDGRRVADAARLLQAEGKTTATRRDIERTLGVGNRVAGRLLPAVNEAMAARRTKTAGADND